MSTAKICRAVELAATIDIHLHELTEAHEDFVTADHAPRPERAALRCESADRLWEAVGDLLAQAALLRELRDSVPGYEPPPTGIAMSTNRL